MKPTSTRAPVGTAGALDSEPGDIIGGGATIGGGIAAPPGRARFPGAAPGIIIGGATIGEAPTIEGTIGGTPIPGMAVGACAIGGTAMGPCGAIGGGWPNDTAGGAPYAIGGWPGGTIAMFCGGTTGGPPAAGGTGIDGAAG